MLQSKLFAKTLHEDPKDEISINAKLLSRAGFIHKLMAGAYQYLPLGLRTLVNIENIIREEMNKLGANEVLMPALHPKEYWEKTGRFHGFDALFKVVSHFDKEFALAPTHEESIVPLVQRSPLSYKDFPFALYQIQTKFRDEPRAKSGLLRGREFRMKDLYSFHISEESLHTYYELVADVYTRLFLRLGLKTLRVKASGGTFSKYSDEFQVVVPTGEDVIFVADSGEAFNGELMPQHLRSKEVGSIVEHEGKKWAVRKSTEVGNIFKLYTKYSKPFDLSVLLKDGAKGEILMGCYGIGSSRIMGTVVEVHHDERGIIWPQQIAPFQVHLLSLADAGKAAEFSKTLYERIVDMGVSILYDDRSDRTAGEKFADADLIGIPIRAVVSERTTTAGKVEIKKRSEDTIRLLSEQELFEVLLKK
ncbi:MAG: hypothetical protein A3C80_01870 [Candidatus Ryanbacteria bacterium RIFCSPHIGHO2_02_FULL_45_43]|uniref:Proline--tRNA ligase n=1 Tax=Candidatus Ryanbacteria bacterium RIFCSPHIGHO2_01_45_13 TaxID=1802112 RepID=A0A1G2FYR4_9BACT|nr:MAG: hypothetical protein A2718_02705 [Candidatus Ryanbacteria bacterium RIFCSPHIGHO2_01_FULL_44_130]OGZ42987.1 MAG: hypothetical protein A2W41_02645 [Candidatus Ryanbacteria bacterium RIFCSPHIGHO2_01_45_13]OGZ48692.1 MAG: hypothetical protein A3C80_01870 [Candidatus Ryanbacteria bacterium RIFCSPHIGHO2_02_FULL_45_43]OGZ50632.1 MAG: hypothetical protein A3E55_03350 [Candidatus Ryanbacteria bacterium RIFCSPHIGHO2_12_FULL_44_20]OGZ51938.1 MAG: hypothetical protein A3A17_00725 [Candidatus Ryanba